MEYTKQSTDSSEIDPSGKSSHEAGSKLDGGKNRLSLVFDGFANALWAVGEVGTIGAAKYTDNGWMKVENGIQRYTDAMLRHKLKEVIEGPRDADTGCLHAAQYAWNALARLELMLRCTKTK